MVALSWWRYWRSPKAGADRAERAVTKLLWERRFERLCLLVLVVLYLLGFHTQQATNGRIDRESDRTTRTLCVFRHDLEDRAAASREFLLNHPQGVAGIPASAIKVSLVGQERTIQALAGLRCG